MPTFLSGHGELVDLAVLLVAHGQVVGLRALRLVVGHGHVHHGEVARVEPRHRLGLRLPTVVRELEDLLRRKEGRVRFRDLRSKFKDGTLTNPFLTPVLAAPPPPPTTM